MGPHSATGVRKRKEHMKPQESYIAMISSAILSTPEKRMTLSEINEYLMKNYECFRGEYKGWKNSVRHNLSFNKCFVKILRNPGRSWAKNNYWGVVVSLLQDYLREDGKFRRRRRKTQGTKSTRRCTSKTEFRSVSSPSDMAKNQRHLQLYQQIFCAQERNVVREYSPLKSRNTFSIDNILQSKQQVSKQPLGRLPRGWIELKKSTIGAARMDEVNQTCHHWFTYSPSGRQPLHSFP